jgi:uncharacterized lipoprotein YajG
MKKNNFKIIIAILVAIAIMSGCDKQLDLKPTNDLTADDVYATSAGILSRLWRKFTAQWR